VKQVVLRKVDGEDILKRIESEGVTLLCGAPAVVARCSTPGRPAGAGPVDPGWRSGVRMVVAGAPPPSKVIERVEASSGGSSSRSTASPRHRRCSPSTAPRWVRRVAGRRAARLQSRAGVAAIGVRMAVDSEGELLARTNNVFEGY